MLQKNEVKSLALSDLRAYHSFGETPMKSISVILATHFPFPSHSLRLSSSGVCQVTVTGQPSSLVREPIVTQRKLMIQQVLDVWSPRRQLPGI